MRKAYFIFCLIAFVVFTVSSCSKEGPAGSQGPAGPQGPAGSNGATGATGTQGSKGDTGTANVIYSTWLNVTYKADTVHVDNIIDTVGYYANISASKLDTSILSHGDIHIYLNIGDSVTPNVVLLPYLDVFSGLSITPSFQIQNISLYSNGNVSTTTDQKGFKTLQYRYVLVPGSVSGNAVIHPPDWKDYNAVKNFYNIPD